jgi:peptide/nickel transport system ATP-binding protein/oligopeptide transport system ATP-binding protein
MLEVQNLRTEFFSKKESVTVVKDVSFSIAPGRVLGVVGESGCGKSATALSIMGLLPPNGRISGGEVRFKGQELTRFSQREFAKIRGNRISMIFQDSLTSLNPVKRIGTQLSEVFIVHQKMNKQNARVAAIKMLSTVGIAVPEQRIFDYPHQLSGGMRQRVMIAMAFACSPELLIADEPTTALDVTIQNQILTGLKHLKDHCGTAILFITHDFGVMADMADDLLVMYAGEVVEHANADQIFETPLHPYTRGLLQSIPRIDRQMPRLYSISGSVPSPGHFPRGCRFSERCSMKTAFCSEKEPPLIHRGDHMVRCWLYAQEERGNGC